MFVQSDGITMAAFGGVGLRGDTPLRPAVTRSHRRDSPQPFSLRYWSGGKITFWRGPDRGETVDPVGNHYRVSAAKNLIPAHQSHIPLYFGGSSPAAMEVAARHIDFYLTWGEPPELVAEKIARTRELAAAAGRKLRFGIRLHVIARDTVEEKVLDLQKTKRDLASAIISQDNSVIKNLQKEDLELLLS